MAELTEQSYKTHIGAIYNSITRLNDDYTRLSGTYETLTEEISDMKERLSSVETNISWIKGLVWAISSGVLLTVVKVWFPI